MANETGYKVTINATLPADLTDLDFLQHLQNSLEDVRTALHSASVPAGNGDDVLVVNRNVAFYDARVTPYTRREVTRREVKAKA